MQSKCQDIRTLPNGVSRVNWAGKNFHEFPSWERQEEVRRQASDKKSDDMTSKAERKRKLVASPVEFRRSSLARGNE